jgi:succinylglutamic semialdehyde dehydrogenase
MDAEGSLCFLVNMDFDFVDGRFVSSVSPDATFTVTSPADDTDVVGNVLVSRNQIEEAVMAARRAFGPWRKLSLEERSAFLKRYQAGLKRHLETLTQSIAREIGKPLWEAKTEVQAMVTKIDVTLHESLRYVKDIHIDDLPGEIRYRPHGVVAVLGPFNFPGHLPNGQIVPALLAGNTVVFKPSEKAPLTARLMAQCFFEANFPAGVLNVVQGQAPIAEALSTHRDIDALLFTGSLQVGQKIMAANAHRPGLLVALELGGKNASLVFGDCDLERTAREIAFSGFATAGQRCTCTSRVIATRDVAEKLALRLAEIAKQTRVGHFADANIFCGPVISSQSEAQLLKAQTLAVKAGFAPLAHGGKIMATTRGHFVQPAVHLAPQKLFSVPGYTDTELFAPDLAIFAVDSLEEALWLANDTPYGLSAAVFTENKALFEKCAEELRVGVLHHNRSSAGASGRLPFGGIKSSGNHRPAGILMGASCVYPMGVQHPALPVQTSESDRRSQDVVLNPLAAKGVLPTWPGMTLS